MQGLRLLDAGSAFHHEGREGHAQGVEVELAFRGHPGDAGVMDDRTLAK